MYSVQRTHSILGEPTPPTMLFTSFSVQDGGINSEDISSRLVGTDYLNYSAPIFESLIWRLGNYAHDHPPINPVNGQLWFDTSTDTLKLLTGDDYSNEWASLKASSTVNMSENIIPDINNQYVIGENFSVWNNLHVSDMYVRDDLLLSASTSSKDVDTLVPSTQYNVTNVSNVDGDSLGDAMTRLYARASTTDTVVVDVDQQGGTYNLVPDGNIRYRFTSEVPITLNLQYGTNSPSRYFEVVGAALGLITLSSDSEVTLTVNDASNAREFRVAYFSLLDRIDSVGNESVSWAAIGDFN